MSPPRRPPRSRAPQRGMTLAELLVGAVITTIILAAVGGAVVAVQGSYVAESQVREVAESGRAGMSFLERTVRLAGYGLDPRFAFDFDALGLPGQTKDNHQFALPDGTQVVTDDLAFRYRDPAFLRRGSLVGNQLTLQTPFGVKLPAGQALILSCHGGQKYYVVRLAGPVNDGDAITAAIENAGDPFPPFVAESCLEGGSLGEPAYVMLVHEIRVRLREMGGRSFLVAYRDFRPVAANENFVTLAQDVESFQVAYVMNRPRPDATVLVPAVDANSNPVNWVLGDKGSSPNNAHPNPAVQPPLYETPYDDALRYNAHPANIRSVRLSLALRSMEREAKRREFPPIVLENAPVLPAVADGYYRTSITSAVRVPNMLSRSFFNPPLKDALGEIVNWNGG